MSYTFAETRSYTYTITDIETVVRRFTADIVMIAQSSEAITEAKAREYAHDVEVLAKYGYLEKVDLTLFSGVVEIRATHYVVDTSAGDLAMGARVTDRGLGSLQAEQPGSRIRQGRRDGNASHRGIS